MNRLPFTITEPFRFRNYAKYLTDFTDIKFWLKNWTHILYWGFVLIVLLLQKKTQFLTLAEPYRLIHFSPNSSFKDSVTILRLWAGHLAIYKGPLVEW